MNLNVSEEDIDRIIEMAWEDRTPFSAIEAQFNFNEAEVIKLMRLSLKTTSFKRWRKRVHSTSSNKHIKKRSISIVRFKCSRHRLISGNRISKKTY